jgi:PrgI family protein
MASYQIPQFLDSGDNILGPLNLIQFGYVLGGAFISFLIYTIFSAAIPAFGIFNLVPSALPLLFALFLAMGKFNGRNIEIYVMKWIVSKLKPQTLVFKRHAETADLDEKLAKISETAIQKEWAERIVEEQLAKTGVASFNTINSEDKAQRIRNLSFTIDTSMRNTLASVKAKEIELEGTQHTINVLANIKNKNRNYSQSPLLQPAPTPLKQTDQSSDEINFFKK